MRFLQEQDLARIDPNFHLNPFHVPQELAIGNLYQALDNPQPFRPLPIQAPFQQHLVQAQINAPELVDKRFFESSLGG